jgi:glycosyltransferase involved in cell wall biosynthesis
VRERCPQLRVVGSGLADPDVQAAFDDWVPYGQPHEEYVRLAFGRAVAMVVGWEESLGLAVAEAQVSGACIISSPGQVLSEMLVPEAAIDYEPGDADALVEAVAAAANRDPEQIRAQAAERFDLTTMAWRVRAAIGL